MKNSGFDELSKSLREVERALSELDGDVASVRFDPNDPESIEQAIRSAYAAIDAKLEPYSKNEVVAGLANDLKENCRASILERAAAARLEQDNEE